MKNKVMHDTLSSTEHGKALLGVIEAAGGKQELANALGITLQIVENWVYISKRVSRWGAVQIEEKFEGVTKEQLRPDVADWSAVTGCNGSAFAELKETERGKGLLLVMSRVKNSRKALARMLGLKTSNSVGTWISRGYIPKKQVKAILALPEFSDLTAEMIRPDLHELDY